MEQNESTENPTVSHDKLVIFMIITAAMVGFSLCMFGCYINMRRKDAASANVNRLPPNRDAESNGIELTSRPTPSCPKPPPTYAHLRACCTCSSGINGIPDECIICLDGFQNESLVRTLPCRHVFHAQCITNWFLGDHDTCPICNVYCPSSDQVGLVFPTEPTRAMLTA